MKPNSDHSEWAKGGPVYCLKTRVGSPTGCSCLFDSCGATHPSAEVKCFDLPEYFGLYGSFLETQDPFLTVHHTLLPKKKLAMACQIPFPFLFSEHKLIFAHSTMVSYRPLTIGVGLSSTFDQWDMSQRVFEWLQIRLIKEKRQDTSVFFSHLKIPRAEIKWLAHGSHGGRRAGMISRLWRKWPGNILWATVSSNFGFLCTSFIWEIHTYLTYIIPTLFYFSVAGLNPKARK